MPLIHIKTKKLEFKFNIEGKYTLLKGDSGIGKTTFYDLVSRLDIGTNSGVTRLSKTPIVAVPLNFEGFSIGKYKNCIIVIDEDCSIFNRTDCASILRESKNYFIIINRAVNFLPVHECSVCTLQCSNHFYTLKHLYDGFDSKDLSKVNCIIVEDSSIGFSFVGDV